MLSFRKTVGGTLALACVALLSVFVLDVTHRDSYRELLSVSHNRDRGNPLEPSLVRDAVVEVSKLLQIPLAEVKQMDKRIEARTQAQLRHAVHSMMLAANITAMNSCGGEYKGCKPLAVNILAVAAEIEVVCSAKFFQADEYEKCEAEIAAPLCSQTSKEFPKMCSGFVHGYTVDDGYIGSTEPANIHGEFCQACARLNAAGGCFAESSLVRVLGNSDLVPLRDVHAGDMVESVRPEGESEWTPVLFTYTHKEPGSTIRVSWEGASDSGVFELTRWHPVPLQSAECGKIYCGQARIVPAERLALGDVIYTQRDGQGGVARVTALTAGSAMVRYAVTDSGMIVVNGAVGASYSTMSGSIEILPFRTLHRLLPSLLGAVSVRESLALIMESPLLAAFEAVMHRAMLPSKHRSASVLSLCPSVFKDQDKLQRLPMAFLVFPACLNVPFAKDLWQAYVSLILGVPVPGNIQPKGPDGLLRPCCHFNALLDALGRHKLVCKYSGKKTAHDHLGPCVMCAGRRSSCGYTDTQVPPHTDSNKKGDALLNLTYGIDLVLDLTVVHPSSATGVLNEAALRMAYNSKMAKHDHAYSSERQGHQLSFLPYVVTTFGVLGPEFLPLLYFMARQEAEVIVIDHHPDADCEQMVGYCFGASRVCVGRALARGLGSRALSYTKYGFHQRPNHAAAFSAFVEQDLHMLDGRCGVDMHGMADELIASVP